MVCWGGCPRFCHHHTWLFAQAGVCKQLAGMRRKHLLPASPACLACIAAVVVGCAYPCGCCCCLRFRVPAYYALILRSLTVLEGLALQADPNYKLLGRAYPYIARRLLTDPAPQLRASFEDLIIKVGRQQQWAAAAVGCALSKHSSAQPPFSSNTAPACASQPTGLSVFSSQPASWVWCGRYMSSAWRPRPGC